MSQQCPKCGSPVQAGHRFCSVCGHTLVSAPAAEVASEEISGASAGSEVAAAAPDEQAPVTYIVQRYDPLAAPLTPAAPSQPQPELPVRIQANTEPIAPFPVFGPPPLSGASAGPAAEQPRASIPPPPPQRNIDLSQVGQGTSTYGNFAQADAPRLASGAFAPYEGGAVRQLEKPVNQRSWLMPVLVAGVAALVLLTLGGAYLLLSRQQSATVNQVDEEESLKQTVRVSNDEQIKAWRELDTEVLKGTRVGDVLKENIDMVNMLKENNMYAVPVNQRLDFIDVQINGNNATVRTVETWTVTFYNRDTKEVVQQNGPDTLHETYFMVKQNGKWMVSELKIDEPQNTPGSST